MQNSNEILAEIKKANRILLACHEDTDPDSIASNLLLKRFITSLGKQAEIVLVDKMQEAYKMLDPKNEIKELVDWANFDFSQYDLFIIPDTNEFKRIGIYNNSIVQRINIPIVNIDHHQGEFKDTIHISDPTFSSTSEMIFYLLEEWGFKFDEESVTLALTGIVSDTGSFTYGITPRVFQTVSKLIELGADYNKIKLMLDGNNSELQIRLWSKILTNLHVDYENKFAYTFLSYEDYQGFEEVVHPTRTTSDMFLRTIIGTNFGIVMIEKTKGDVQLSIRSRLTSYPVIELCRQLGGGGHATGGGASIKGLPLEEAVKKAVDAAVEFARNNSLN